MHSYLPISGIPSRHDPAQLQLQIPNIQCAGLELWSITRASTGCWAEVDVWLTWTKLLESYIYFCFLPTRTTGGSPIKICETESVHFSFFVLFWPFYDVVAIHNTCLDRWCCLWPLHIAKRLMRCCTDTGCYFTYWNMAKHISMVNCGGEPRVQQQHSGLCRAMQKSGPVQNKLHNLVLSSHTVQIMWLVHTCSREHGNMWVISTPHSTLTRNAMGHRLLYFE